MANTKQSRKRVLQTERRTLVNTMRRNRVKTFIRRVEQAVAKGDKEQAVIALRQAQPEIMRAAGKGILHRNTASRRVSKLARMVKNVCLAEVVA